MKVMKVMLVLLYVFVGMIISIPYTFLANGNVEHFVWVAVFSPPAVLLLIILLRMRLMSLFSKFSYIIWLLTPVILNGVAILTKWLGYELAASSIFNVRYMAPLLLLIVVMVMGLIFGITKHCLAKIIPDRNPPSGPSGPDQPKNMELNRGPSQQENPNLSRFNIRVST